MYSKYKDYLEQPQRELKTWKAALYIRLSREDGDKIRKLFHHITA